MIRAVPPERALGVCSLRPSATLSGPGLGDWLGSESLRSSWTDEPVLGSGPVMGHGDTRRADEGAAPRRARSSCWVNVWCHSWPPPSAGAPGAADDPLPHGARCGAGLERHGARLAVRLLQGPAADLLRGGGAVAPPTGGPSSPCGVLSVPVASQSGFLVSSGFVRACHLCVAWAWVHTVRGCRAEFSRERWVFGRVKLLADAGLVPSGGLAGRSFMCSQGRVALWKDHCSASTLSLHLPATLASLAAPCSSHGSPAQPM